MLNETVFIKLDKLRNLTEDWDGEGAPKPSQSSVDTAKSIIGEIIKFGIDPKMEIDADVFGGVSVTIGPVWFSFMNNGSVSASWHDNDSIVMPWPEKKEKILEKLREISK